MDVLKTEQRFDEDLPAVFSFFARPENLERITPDWLRFSIETPSPVPMAAGQSIDYRLALLGVPLRWKSEITVYEPPHRFIDVQRRGPYRHWHHEHRFRSEGGLTVVEDVVHFAAPLARLTRPFVTAALRRIFQARREALATVFHERAWSGVRLEPMGDDGPTRATRDRRSHPA
jgi:ligand-binding SRPBCC domain-containing protein